MEKRKRKSCPCRIYRVDATDVEEVLVPVGQQYDTVANAMSGLREHVRLLPTDTEPGKYVIARIQAELTATAKQRVDVILEEN